MTKFKVGDRVRHAKFGAGTVVESLCDDEPKSMVCVHFETWDEYDGEDDYHAICEVALWRDPPLDTRKRLREYTDLADGDAVVIAGVPLKVNGGVLEQDGCEPEWHVYSEMIVDEVRRKPRMKKRRVYEEVDAKDAREGDLLEHDRDPRVRARLSDWDGDPSDLEGATVLRLVEETEVPR